MKASEEIALLLDYLEEKPHKIHSSRSELEQLIEAYHYEKSLNGYKAPTFEVLQNCGDGVTLRLFVESIQHQFNHCYRIVVSS